MPRLTPDVRSAVYSAAIMGTGVKHWQNIVADLEKIERPEKILIVFITDDFFRADWTFRRSQLACLSKTGDCDNEYWHPISDRMAERADERYALRSSGRIEMGKSKFLRYHFIATHQIVKKIKSAIRGDRKPQVLEEAVQIISDLADKYPLKMIWVNQKNEAKGLSFEALQLSEKLEGFDVTRCAIPAEGFMPRDSHPSAEGYEILKSCVERVVRAWR